MRDDTRKPPEPAPLDFYRFDVERAVMAAQTLTPTQTLVMLTMLTYTGPQRPTCYASQVKLSKQTHLSRSTLAKAIAELQAAGALVVVKQRQRANGGDGPIEFAFSLDALAKMANRERKVSKRGGRRKGDEPTCPKCGVECKRIELPYGCAFIGTQGQGGFGLYELPPKMRPLWCSACQTRWLTVSDGVKHARAAARGAVRPVQVTAPHTGVARRAVLEKDIDALCEWQVI